MLQGFSATSMVLASAPAVAPAPTYPAAIERAIYDSQKDVIVVDYTVNTSGYVAFDIETNSGRKSNLNKDYRLKGKHKTEIRLNPEWSIGAYVSLMISVNGSICGGIGVPVKRKSVKINEITHDAVKNTVTVDYTTNNVDSECRLKVFVDGNSSILKFDKVVPAGSNKYSLSSSLFEENVIYRFELSCEDLKSAQNFNLYAMASGKILGVRLSGIGANDLPTIFSCDYNLSNAKEPYLCIKTPNAYGTIVKKFPINNTNGKEKTFTLTNISSVLNPNTAYTACLYDGTKDLCIYGDFNMPEAKTYVYNFTWTYLGPGTNKVCIMPSKNIHPSITQVTIKVDRYKNGMKDSYQYTASGDARKDYYFGVSGDYTYIITVSWPNGERKTIQAYICAK